MEGWTMVYQSVNLPEINYMTEILKENSITAVILDKRDSFYLIGEIELYVPMDQAFNALQIIKKLESE